MNKKTELDKLKNCEMFWNGDPEIGALKSRARSICNRFNQTTEEMPEERLAILKELFGDCTDNIFIKPPFYCDFGFNLHVGKKFFANYACVMLDAAPITIGDNCLIGPECGFYTVSHHFDPVKRAEDYVYGKPITVGNDVWFGGHCVVLPGVTIGNNVIVGAGSVVTKDIPDNAIVAGNPAQIIRYNNN